MYLIIINLFSRYTIGEFLDHVSHSVDGLDRHLRNPLQLRRRMRQPQQPEAAQGDPEPIGPEGADQQNHPVQVPQPLVEVGPGGEVI
jgi:hypothetical protein